MYYIMTQVEKYLKEHVNYDMHLVDKKFGNGKQLVQFFYREQQSQFKQGFLAYVDNQRWKYDQHEIMSEVENYLIESEGIIDESDFVELNEYDCCKNEICEKHESEYKQWYKDEFPKIDLHYGGMSYFNSAFL